jgi:sec-independent protein translocase protein TatC
MSQLAKPAATKHRKKLSRQHKQATTFSEHIAELRGRVLWVGLFFAIGSVLAYSYRVPILHAILEPLKGQKLVYLTPGGGFSFIFQISIYAGLLFAAPLLVYHLHAFIKPALPPRAQRSAGRIVSSAVILMLGGVFYGYFVAVPAALHFLMDFAGDAVTPNLTADSYLSFFLAYTGGLALLALLPLVLVFGHWIKPLTPGGLLKSERWVIVFAFIAAAIVTPTPDVVNQTMIAAPVIGLYQLGVIVIFKSIHNTKKATRAAEKRKLLLQEAEERRLRSLKTQAAYLANTVSATSNSAPADTLFAAAASIITESPKEIIVADNTNDSNGLQPVRAQLLLPTPPTSSSVNNASGNRQHRLRSTGHAARAQATYAPRSYQVRNPRSQTPQTQTVRSSYALPASAISESQPQQA